MKTIDLSANKNFHKGHRKRVKDKYLSSGINQFHSHEILELLLFFSIPQADTNPIAHSLVEKYGSLYNILNAAKSKELIAFKGVKENTVCLLKLVSDVSDLYLKERSERRPCTLERLIVILLRRFRVLTEEKMMLLLLDKKLNILYDGSVISGNNDVFKHILTLSLEYTATYAIIAHNHPFGEAVPSTEDIEFTKQIRDKMEKVGVRLIDHFIFSRDDYNSIFGCIRRLSKES